MPAILRIFLYQTDASLTRTGSTTPYDQGRGLSERTSDLRTGQGAYLDVQADPGSEQDDYEPEYHMLFHISMYLRRGR